METFGDIVSFYALDRQTTVDSFRCYWQIDNMVTYRKFVPFKVMEFDDLKFKYAISDDKNMIPSGSISLPQLYAFEYGAKWS